MNGRREVRFGGHSRPIVLSESFSGFDSERTWRPTALCPLLRGGADTILAGAMYASDFFDCLDLCVAEIVALARMSS